jgi:hypothetical protein
MKILGNLSDIFKSITLNTAVKLEPPPPPERFFELKQAIFQIADVGLNSVNVIRDSFGSGIAPFTKVGSGSVANYLQTFVQGNLARKIIQDTHRFGMRTSPGGGATPLPKAELDTIEIIEDIHRGILDQFTAHLTVSLPASDMGRVQRVRIFRAYVQKANVPRPGFAALMDAPVMFSKGTNTLFSNARKADQLGVGNVVTSFIAENPGASSLSVVSPAERVLRPSLLALNTNKSTEMVATGLVTFQADRSVVENLSVYLNRRSFGDVNDPARPPLSAGKSVGINVLKGSQVSSIGTIVESGNDLGYTAIGDVTPHGPSVRFVGDIAEISFVDPSVVFGGIYSFFACAVGPLGELGPRSRLVEVAVTRTIPPQSPQITYGLTAGHPRFTIRCTKGTSHVEVYRSGRAAINSTVMGSDQSLIIEGPSNKVGEFYHAGDLGLGPDGSTTFIDRDIVPGDRPTYRFYAVDPYGLKSQTPFSCSMMIPDNGERLPLSIPSLTSEQLTSGKAAIRVSVTCDDPRIVGFTFSRRDVTVNERAVHQANQPEYFTFGYTDAKRAGSRRGPTPLDLAWPSVIFATSGSASFVDTSVRLDRIYQYAVHATDRRGNKSFLVGAQPVGVYSKPTINGPTDLSARVVIDGNIPKAVLLSWTPGTIDFSPNHLLEDQDVLAATSVRSVFQVERRLRGAPFWDALPATTESYFIDPSIDDETPTSRPAYVVKGEEYEYRVLTMQSGGFLSPRTDAILVSVAPSPMQPETLWVRVTNIAVRPMNVVVSWDMDTMFINHWEVQRAITNKSYGSRISSMDSAMAQQLEYQTIASVTPEASRASGLKADRAVDIDRSVFVGNRFLIDPEIDPANSYFYRVRSIGSLGVVSEWTYGGVSVTDHTFDRKFLSTVSDNEKVNMVRDHRAVKSKLNIITARNKMKIGRLR